MSSRPRIPVLVGAVCAAVLLAGCSSSGTVGAGSSNGAAGAAGGGTAGGTGGTSGAGGTGGTGGSSSGAPDAGCTQAMLAIQNAEKAQNSSNAQAAVQGAQTSIGELRAAANATKKPGGKYAINRVADDLQDIVTKAAQGQTPDTSAALTDAEQVAAICGL